MGLSVLKISGKNVGSIFQNESGGHRWQRVPPNEKRGRVHTSTITVAVLEEPTEAQITVKESDLDISTCRGSGAGGQHRNVTDSAVIVKHIPSGLTVRCESERSQHLNKATAVGILRARLWDQRNNQLSSSRAEDRKRQVGSGMRGDKRRTIRSQDGQVVDHITGKTWRYKDYIRGDWE